MNIKTGEIKYFEPEDEIPEDWIQIYEGQMTKKQRETLHVSKHDSVSELGKLFTGNRAERRKQAKEHKRKLKRAIREQDAEHE